MVKTDKTFIWKGDYFSPSKLYGGEIGFTEDGAFIVRAFTTPPPEPRGTLFSGAPISDAEYRKTHQTRTGYKRTPERLEVYCDWGRLHWVEADADVLDALVADLEANGVTERLPLTRMESEAL